jgi:hypothetical protein
VAATRNGTPSRTTRRRRNARLPLRSWLGQTNNPDRKNIKDIPKMSLNDSSTRKVLDRWLSTIGNASHERGSIAREAWGAGANG